MIAPGQTMDILLNASQDPSHYYMLTRPFFESEAPFDNTTASAILRYEGNYTAPSSPIYPTQLPNITDRISAYNFTSQVRALATEEHPVNVPKNITERLYVTVSVNTIVCPNSTCEGPDGNRMAASLNNVSFDVPNIDILQAYYK